MSTVWLAWIIISAATFAVLEWYGWAKFGIDGTLSAHVRYWTSLHPLVPFSLGCSVGALALHFWGK